MAYLNPTITLRFDGKSKLDFTDDDGKPIVLPNLGKDIWITIRNPMLMPQSLLMPKQDVQMKEDGTPVDRNEALQAGAEVVAGLIVDWSLTDIMDLSDDARVLPLPTNADVLRNQVPVVVGDMIATVLARARNPR
jgi:hypothetical protein